MSIAAPLSADVATLRRVDLESPGTSNGHASGNGHANGHAVHGPVSGHAPGAHAPVARAAAPVVSPYFAWSGLLTRLTGLMLIVPGAAITAVLVVLVRLTSKGPGLYSQQRVGLNGKLFTMYKIRTMRTDAESRSGAVWATSTDPRITPLGRILRALHLDELPQIVNMIRGEMCLMGPRPERPEFTEWLEKEIPGYTDRLLVRPGITGLAQINLPPDSDLDSVRRKLVLDREYIETATLGLDIRIAMRTLFRLLNIHGDWPSKFLGIYREVRLPTDVASSPAAAEAASVACELSQAC